mmetsp:Transcript_33161/g.91377  ORF Transcript_33161/g.91377 Transcript_33161/m.91377 type:complete len:206 (-) Transcript_33161:1183-1800(-)
MRSQAAALRRPPPSSVSSRSASRKTMSFVVVQLSISAGPNLLRAAASSRASAHFAANALASSMGVASHGGMYSGMPGAVNSRSQSKAAIGPSSAAATSALSAARDMKCSKKKSRMLYEFTVQPAKCAKYFLRKGWNSFSPTTLSSWQKRAIPFMYGTTEKASSGSKPPPRSGTSLVKLWSLPKWFTLSTSDLMRPASCKAASSAP